MYLVNQLQSMIPNVVFLPWCTVEVYAGYMGQSVDSIRAQIKAGNIPTIKKGKYRYVNIVALTRECADAAATEERATTAAAKR